MDRPVVLSQLLADGAVVDEAGDEDALGLGGAIAGAGAVGRGQDKSGAAASLGRVSAWGIAEIETWQGQAAPLAPEQHSPGSHLAGQLARFLHFQARPHSRAAG